MVKKDPSPAKLRELVMQALYQKEISGSSNTDLIKQFKQNYKNFNLSNFEIYLKEIKIFLNLIFLKIWERLDRFTRVIMVI